jgi:hypothetical protein
MPPKFGLQMYEAFFDCKRFLAIFLIFKALGLLFIEGFILL